MTSPSELVAELRGFAEGSESARASLMRDAADMIERLVADLDTRFAESDHQSAKYYQRMRAAEKEMHMRELHHFEEEQKSAELQSALEVATSHETDWEYGAGYEADNGIEMRWFSMESDAFTIREAAEHEVDRFADPQVRLIRRHRPGVWEPAPVDELANQTEENR